MAVEQIDRPIGATESSGAGGTTEAVIAIDGMTCSRRACAA